MTSTQRALDSITSPARIEATRSSLALEGFKELSVLALMHRNVCVFVREIASFAALVFDRSHRYVSSLHPLCGSFRHGLTVAPQTGPE